FGRLGQPEMQQQDFAKAATWFKQGVEILQRLDEEGKLKDQPLYQGWLKEQRDNLRLCQAGAKTLADLDLVLQQPKDLVPRWLELRIRVLAKGGKPADMAATADKLLDPDDKTGDRAYDAARGYALAGTAARDDAQAQEQYAARAVALLHRAKDAGHFKNPDTA